MEKNACVNHRNKYHSEQTFWQSMSQPFPLILVINKERVQVYHFLFIWPQLIDINWEPPDCLMFH